MTTHPEEINVCQDCHERRGRPPVIDYPTNPFTRCHDCKADTDLLAINNPETERRWRIDYPDDGPAEDPIEFTATRSTAEAIEEDMTAANIDRGGPPARLTPID